MAMDILIKFGMTELRIRIHKNSNFVVWISFASIVTPITSQRRRQVSIVARSVVILTEQELYKYTQQSHNK